MDLLSSLILTPIATVAPSNTVSKEAHYLAHGHSPLRNKYKLLSTNPDNSDVIASGTRIQNDTSVRLPRAASSSPTSLNPRSSSRCGTPEAEQEDPEDYDPEYATYLVASMQSQAEKRDEEIDRIRKLLDCKRDQDDKLVLVVSERMLANCCKRYLSGSEERVGEAVND